MYSFSFSWAVATYYSIVNSQWINIYNFIRMCYCYTLYVANWA